MRTLGWCFQLFAVLALLLTPAQPPVHAGGLLLRGVSASVGGGVAAPAIAFVACTADATDLTTYTFTAANVGTAAADRITIVGVVAEDALANFSVSTLTVGSDSATASSGNLIFAAVVGTAIYALANPSGAAEDIVVTFSEPITGAAVCVWSATGINIAEQSWRSATVPTSTAISLDHFTYAEGVSVGICGASTNGDSTTWVGLTESADVGGAEFSYSAATFTEDGTPGSPLTTSCDYAGAGPAHANVAHWAAAAPADPSKTFVACTSDATDQTTYTYTAHSISTAADNRIVVVGVLGEDGAITFGVASMTIAGTAAVEVVDEDGTGVVDTAIYYLPVPTGTTATIAVTFTEAVTSSVICVWALYNIANLFPFSSIQDDDTASGALVLTHSTATKGISVGVCNNSGVADAATWAGLTENTDTESAEQDYSAADLTEDAATSLAATCDWTGANDASGSAAHWR